MKRWVFIVMLAWSGLLAATEVDQPGRSFGLVLGDLLIQQVALEPDHPIPDLAGFGAATRVNLWLERLPVVVMNKEGGQQLRITYQIVNVPTTVTEALLPGLRIPLDSSAGNDADDSGALDIAPRPYSLGPMLAATGSSLPVLQPDRQPTLIETRLLQQNLWYTAMSLIILLLAWLAWWLWRNRRDTVRLPFAAAYAVVRASARESARESAGIGAERATGNLGPEAWKAVHHALNEAAGRTLSTPAIDTLVQERPWLAPHRVQIEHFRQASAARFFEQPARSTEFALADFSLALYRAERRHSQ